MSAIRGIAFMVVVAGGAFAVSRAFAAVREVAPQGAPDIADNQANGAMVWLPIPQSGPAWFDLTGWVPAAPEVAATMDGDSQAQANERAFLAMIRAAEGTAGADPYRVLFGGGRFEDLSDHPRRIFTFTQTDGKVNKTTAAGAYQFLSSTWDDVRGKLGLPDFGPESQDRAALELIRRAGALDDVRAGRFDDAVRKCARTWASLPGSPYAQKTRSAQFVRAAIEGAGGVYA